MTRMMKIMTTIVRMMRVRSRVMIRMVTLTGSTEDGCETDATPRGARKNVVEVLCT